ncbi:MAG: hypothetical protein ACYC7F_02465 [Gemmatimonadaceae bacterium]
MATRESLGLQLLAPLCSEPNALFQRAACATEELSCTDYLLDRPLSTEAMVRAAASWGGLLHEEEEEVLGVLRLFRAAVRGIDDLLDSSMREPSGRPATWVVYSKNVTWRCSLDLLDSSLSAIHNVTIRKKVADLAAEMALSCALETRVALNLRFSPRDLETLAVLGDRLMRKETAYWDIIVTLLADHWRGSKSELEWLAQQFRQVGILRQLTDDVRDWEEDVRIGRASTLLTIAADWSAKRCFALPLALSRFSSLLTQPEDGIEHGSLEVLSHHLAASEMSVLRLANNASRPLRACASA